MRIAFAASAMRRGGAEQRIVNLMDVFEKDGHEVVLVTGKPVDWIKHMQVKVCGWEKPVVSSMARAWGFCRAFRKGRYDVIVANCYISALGAVHARKFTGTPVVKISYGPEPGHLSAVESGLKYRIIRHAYRGCDTIITPSRWAHDYVKRVFGVENGIIPIGIDLKRFDLSVKPAARSSMGASAKDTVVLYVGHMIKRKGLDDLLDAARIVLEKRRGVKFVFIGNSWHAAEIAEKRKFLLENGLEKNVKFLGEVDNALLPAYYKAADIFCMPSWEEALGIVYLEAMALEKPIVAARVAAVPEVVRDGVTGLLAPARNPVELANVLGKMISMGRSTVKMGKKGREVVEKEYTIEREARSFMKLFNSLAQSKSQKGET